MSRALLRSTGGELALPDRGAALIDRTDGGHLIVNPPRPVWERGELAPAELARWSCLVAAAGRAMLESLPQLDGGCLNYWEAGNWSLHDAAEPVGPKRPRSARSVHLHLVGRSPRAADPRWAWGEAPIYPRFAERHAVLAGYARLEVGECRAVVERTIALLGEVYGFVPHDLEARRPCSVCGLPTPASGLTAEDRCGECEDAQRA